MLTLDRRAFTALAVVSIMSAMTGACSKGSDCYKPGDEAGDCQYRTLAVCDVAATTPVGLSAAALVEMLEGHRDGTLSWNIPPEVTTDWPSADTAIAIDTTVLGEPQLRQSTSPTCLWALTVDARIAVKTADGALDETATTSVGWSNFFGGTPTRIGFTLDLGATPAGLFRAAWTTPRPDQKLSVLVSGGIGRDDTSGEVQVTTPLEPGPNGVGMTSAGDIQNLSVGAW
jgi:hypothetical protein